MKGYSLNIYPVGDELEFDCYNFQSGQHKARHRWHQKQAGGELEMYRFRVGAGGVALSDLEEVLGPQAGLLALLSVYTAAENEFHGRVPDGRVIYAPDETAFDTMEEAADLIAILWEKNKMNKV